MCNVQYTQHRERLGNMLKILHRWAVKYGSKSEMFKKHLSYTLVCLLVKNVFRTSYFLAALRLAQIKLLMCLKFLKSSNLIRKSFSVGKIKHTFKNLDMIALQKYSWILSQRFIFLSSDSLHQKTSFALSSSACATPPQDTPEGGGDKTKTPQYSKS